MQDLLIEIQGRVAILIHNGRTFAPRDWRSILEFAQRADLPDLRILSFTTGTANLSAAQRAELLAATGGRMPAAAVFTSSAIARGVVTALSWFKPGVKAFPPHEMEQAMRFLGLTERERSVARSMANRLWQNGGVETV
jgi:hypothetical protein